MFELQQSASQSYAIKSKGTQKSQANDYSVNTAKLVFLTHWGRLTHIRVSDLPIIGSDNGLLPHWCQAIIWINAGILLIGTLGTNFSEILIEILTFSFKKMYLKVSSVKWWPFCPGGDELMKLTHGTITQWMPDAWTLLFCLVSDVWKSKESFWYAVMHICNDILAKPIEWDTDSTLTHCGLSDAIWHQGSGSTLAQVMACCLMAPSHHLNQCWLIINKVQWHS